MTLDKRERERESNSHKGYHVFYKWHIKVVAVRKAGYIIRTA